MFDSNPLNVCSRPRNGQSTDEKIRVVTVRNHKQPVELLVAVPPIRPQCRVWLRLSSASCRLTIASTSCVQKCSALTGRGGMVH